MPTFVQEIVGLESGVFDPATNKSPQLKIVKAVDITDLTACSHRSDGRRAIIKYMKSSSSEVGVIASCVHTTLESKNAGFTASFRVRDVDNNPVLPAHLADVAKSMQIPYSDLLFAVNEYAPAY